MVRPVTPDIRPYRTADAAAVVNLALRAWERVFVSIEATLDSAVFAASYPRGWRAHQAEAVEAALAGQQAWVAEISGVIVGFVTARVHAEESLGEIHMVAVDPDHQGQGIGGRLTREALNWLRSAGATMAMVETGADPGHAAARRTYERAGFAPWASIRYFKVLSDA